MDRPRTIIGLALFFGIIGFMLWGVGNSISTNKYIREVATGSEDDYAPGNLSYAHLFDGAMEQMGINKYYMGEYGMTDKIRFEAVYVSTHSYGDKFASSSGEGIAWLWGWLGDKVGMGASGDLDWDKDRTDVKNISSGEHVYIYPHLNIDLPDAFFNLETYLFVRTFDAYSGGNEWLHEPDVKNVDWSGHYCEWIPQLNCGLMGRYDLYYVIDVAYFDQEVISGIPGINLLTDTELEALIKGDKARFMERYGGVIYGDVSQGQPDSLAYHEIQYSARGGLSVFFDTIRDIQMGWTVFTSTDSEIINKGFEMIMIVFGLIFSLAVYYEIKSYLPFIL